MFEKKITIVSGFYGSGKSEFCLNYGIELRNRTSDSISIVDLDVINPYFRTRSMKSFLKKYEIDILGSILDYAPMADIPQVSPNMLKPIHTNTYGIYDLGGDISGLKVLKTINDHLHNINYQFLLVINIFREETDDVQKIVDYIHLVNNSTSLKITGIINNTNLIFETTVEDYLYGDKMLNIVSNIVNIPIVGGLINEFLDQEVLAHLDYPLLVTSRYLKPYE